MNDATPWIDPELVAAGKLLQSRGLVAPDRTQASLSEVRAATDRIGAFLGEGSVPLERERDRHDEVGEFHRARIRLSSHNDVIPNV